VIPDEVHGFLADAGLIVVSIAAIFGVGRWFGWKHNEITTGITEVKTTLDTHIKDQAVEFDRVECRIEQLETAVLNGGKRE